MFLSTRACVYTIFISPKKHSLLHMVCVSFWFSVVLIVKAWKTKYSHRPLTPVKGWRNKPSHRETVDYQVEAASFSLLVWILENQSLHTWNTWKPGVKNLYVKGWMLFSRIKKRIGEWAYWGQPMVNCTVFLIGDFQLLKFQPMMVFSCYSRGLQVKACCPILLSDWG